MTGVGDAGSFVALSVDSIGGKAAGADPLWQPAIVHLQRAVKRLARETESPIAVAVLFHVPGRYLKPDVVGVRIAERSLHDPVLRIDAALPSVTPESPQHLLCECLIEAVWLAEQQGETLSGLRDLVVQLQGTV